jgi:hypothetical protein
VFLTLGCSVYLLRSMCHAVHRGPVSEKQIERLERVYDILVERGFMYHKSLAPLKAPGQRGRVKNRKGYNLLVRLRNDKAGTLMFLRNSAVPFTNNLSEKGAQDFAVIQSFVGTIRKNGGNILELIKEALRRTIRLSDILCIETHAPPLLLTYG